MFAGFQPSAFQNNAFQVGAVIPALLAGGGGDDGRKQRVKKKKKNRVYYTVNNRIFTDAQSAAEYAASLEAREKPQQDAEVVKQETVLSSVAINDTQIELKTVIPVTASPEYVADLIRAEMEQARLQLKLEAERAEREELKVVSMILSMMFGDDVIIEMNTAPATVQ
jgi:hypothetical protein